MIIPGTVSLLLIERLKYRGSSPSQSKSLKYLGPKFFLGLDYLNSRLLLSLVYLFYEDPSYFTTLLLYDLSTSPTLTPTRKSSPSPFRRLNDRVLTFVRLSPKNVDRFHLRHLRTRVILVTSILLHLSKSNTKPTLWLYLPRNTTS